MELFSQKEDYLEAIKLQMRCRKARNMIAEEIGQHIEDQKAAYISEGDDDHTALLKALEQMGDPVEVGKQLDKIHRPRMEWSILIATLLLCCLGVFAQSSLGRMVSGVHLPNSVNVERHLFFLVLGILVMTAIYYLDYSFLGKYSKVICFLFLAGFFLYAPFGTIVNGSLQHVNAYGLLFIPIYGGILYAYRNKGYAGMIKCLLIGLLAFIIEMHYIAQCSVYLGILFSSLILLTAAALKNWFGTSKRRTLAVILGWLPLFLGLLALYVSMFRSYQLERLKALINIIRNLGSPDIDFQLERAIKLLSNAKLFGGRSPLTDNYLPGFNTEYILTFVICKWGIAAGLLIIGLFAALIGRMIYLSYHQKNSLGMFVGLGCSLAFAIQGGIYILSNLGIQLVAQVNLPFVSYGGSSLIANFLLLGLILNVFRNTNIMKEVPYSSKFTIRIEKVK